MWFAISSFTFVDKTQPFLILSKSEKRCELLEHVKLCLIHKCKRTDSKSQLKLWNTVKIGSCVLSTNVKELIANHNKELGTIQGIQVVSYPQM